MSDRTLFRLGAAAAVVGAVIALVLNAVHPRASDFEDPVRAEIQMVQQSDAWIPIHLGILAGVLLITFGLFAVARSLKGGPGEGVARVALGSLLISTAIGVMGVAVDGYAQKAVADAAEGGRALRGATLAAGTAVGDISWALFMATVIMVTGVTPVLFGAAVGVSRQYPAILGWPVAAVGAASIVVGAFGFLTGPSAAFFWAFLVTSALATLWVLAIGVVLWRRTAAPARAAARASVAPG
jgi:hypothetical protein